MNFYIFFGKSGSGKSFLGDYLEKNYHFLHFDGDHLLTPAMKNYIENHEIFSQTMIDDYTELLKEKIKFFYAECSHSIVISQGLYRNKNRLELLKQFPHIQFVLVHAEEHICFQRVKSRKNGITVEYAKRIDALFEQPQDFKFMTIDNSESNSQAVKLQIDNFLFIQSNIANQHIIG